MKRWLKRLGLALGAVFVLFMIFVTIEHWRGEHALERRLGELKARKEEFSIAALEPAHPSPGQNAALDLASLTNQLKDIRARLGNTPPSLRFAVPGSAVISWRLVGWGHDAKTTNNWEKIGQALAVAEDLLRTIHSAVEKQGFHSGIDFHKGFLDFSILPLVPFKDSALVLNVAVNYELSRRHFNEAKAHLLALVNLAAIQKPEPLVICQLVRHACASIAFQATWQALQAPGWSEADLAELQSVWEKCKFTQDMAGAMQMERALTVDLFSQIRGSKRKLALFAAQAKQVWENSDGSWPTFATQGLMLAWLHTPLWRVAWAGQDELRALNRWQVMIERERFARTNSWAALADFPMLATGTQGVSDADLDASGEELGWYDRYRFLVSGLKFSITDVLIHKTLATQTEQQLVISAIAIQRYELRYSTLPSELKALVPAFIQVLPRDAMDGKPLRYRSFPEGGFLLYSSGDDGKDQGGDCALSPDFQEYRTIWNGKDAVWPTAATAEETAAFIKSSKD